MHTKDIFEMFPNTPDIIKGSLCYFSFKYAHMLTSNKYINNDTLLKYSSEGNIRMVKLILPWYNNDKITLSKCLKEAVKRNHVDVVKVFLITDARLSVDERVDAYQFFNNRNNKSLRLFLDSISFDNCITNKVRWVIVELVNNLTIRTNNKMTLVLLKFAKKYKINISICYINFNKYNIDMLAEYLYEEACSDTITTICRESSKFDKLDILSKFLEKDKSNNLLIWRCLTEATDCSSHSCIEFLLPKAVYNSSVNEIICNYKNCNITLDFAKAQKMFCKTIDLYMRDGRITPHTIHQLVSNTIKHGYGYFYEFEHLMKYYTFNGDDFSIIDNILVGIKSQEDFLMKFPRLFNNLNSNLSINMTTLFDHLRCVVTSEQFEMLNNLYKQMLQI